MPALALKWIFVLDDDYAWPSGRTFAEDCAYEDSSGKRRLEVRRSGEIRVLKGYAWDGFAPRKLYYWAVRIFGGGFFFLYTRRKRGYNGRKVPL